MSLRLQARKATLYWAVAADGGRAKQKHIKKRLIGEFHNSRNEVEQLFQEWVKSGELETIYQTAQDYHKYRLHQWIKAQPQVRKLYEEVGTIDPVDSARLANDLRKPFRSEFKEYNKTVLKKAIKVLQSGEEVEAPHDEALGEGDIPPQTSLPAPQSKSPTTTPPAINRTTETSAVPPLNTAIYHEFFGPDGRRIFEEIRVPAINHFYPTPKEKSAEDAPSEISPSDLIEMGYDDMQAYLESKLGALAEYSETPPLNSGRARDKEAESSPQNLITPSNPKVEALKKYVANLDAASARTELIPAHDYEGVPSLELQQELLSGGKDPELEELKRRDIDISTSVIVSAQALNAHHHLFPQYALICSSQNEEALPLFSFQRMGRALTSLGGEIANRSDPRLFINTNHPWSFFVCGLQGSGKSHSTSCLLESCLIPTPVLGRLQRPLSGLVLHFSQYSSASSFQPCEAAFLSVPSPDFAAHQRHRVPVTVLVSPSNYHGLKAAYSGIPGVKVKKLKLHPRSLNVSAMLALMSVDTARNPPLYMTQIQMILREMATENGSFDYLEFKEQLSRMKLVKGQHGPMEQRMNLLESFLDLDALEKDGAKGEEWDGDSTLYSKEEGALTIIDLSCPFVDEGLACVLFNICLGMFLETPSVGKVVAVDEAHKYINGSTPASKDLTESLLSLIRQQRHFGVRVVVSTQEPTIDPRLIELSNVTLMHRFTSPEWFARLKKHIGMGKTTGERLEHEVFNKIVSLRTGEAYAFAPSAMATGKDGCEKLGGQLLKVKTRKRITWDGGKSILSVD